MNICKRYKELLLTDYIDGEIDTEIRKDIDNHLIICSSCRQFKEDVVEKAINVFNEVSREKVPEGLWSSIKEKMTQKRFREAEEMPSFLQRALGSLSPLPITRLVPVMATIAVLIFVSVD